MIAPVAVQRNVLNRRVRADLKLPKEAAKRLTGQACPRLGFTANVSAETLIAPRVEVLAPRAPHAPYAYPQSAPGSEWQHRHRGRRSGTSRRQPRRSRVLLAGQHAGNAAAPKVRQGVEVRLVDENDSEVALDESLATPRVPREKLKLTVEQVTTIVIKIQ